MQVEMLSQAHAEQAATIEDLSTQLEKAAAVGDSRSGEQQQGTSRAEVQRVEDKRAAAEQAAAAAEEKALQLEHQLQVCISKQIIANYRIG